MGRRRSTTLGVTDSPAAAVGTIHGTMAFDRKDYGMNSGIPFIRIAERVEVNVALEGERVSDLPMVRKKF